MCVCNVRCSTRTRFILKSKKLAREPCDVSLYRLRESWRKSLRDVERSRVRIASLFKSWKARGKGFPGKPNGLTSAIRVTLRRSTLVETREEGQNGSGIIRVKEKRANNDSARGKAPYDVSRR